MSFTIMLEPSTAQDWCDAYNKHQDVYTSDSHRVIRQTANQFGSQLFVKDLNNAFKTGAECIGFSIDGCESDSIDLFIADCNYKVDEIIRRCSDAMADLVVGQYSASISNEKYSLSIYERNSKGVRTFSPLPEALRVLKPLNAIPKKWTLRHVMRLLANRQYVKLETRDRYTDDYAMDAAYNYYKGDLCGLSFLKDLTESPSGWWVSGAEKDGDQLGISCHTFDFKQCIVDLSGMAPKNLVNQEEQNVDSVDSHNSVISENAATENTPGPAGLLMMDKGDFDSFFSSL